MKETFELTAENAGELIDVLEDVTASLENTLGHLGAQMSESDRAGRWRNVERAQALLKKLAPND